MSSTLLGKLCKNDNKEKKLNEEANMIISITRESNIMLVQILKLSAIQQAPLHFGSRESMVDKGVLKMSY